MSPYGGRFGGDSAIPSACALERMASSVRLSLMLITPTGVLPAASSRSYCTWSSVHALPLLDFVSDMVRVLRHTGLLLMAPIPSLTRLS
ncbi:hypothetical protein EV137_1819 [Kribbella pratensis]|uniref:Uncharacterized protein n=1 Tax=Kribbella pratensis TaxID=2512112 RepID=A0ABY2FMY3_9ACTN|nr:hypothetical protein EV137_1819 [Kribbella pratensis]